MVCIDDSEVREEEGVRARLEEDAELVPVEVDWLLGMGFEK